MGKMDSLKDAAWQEAQARIRRERIVRGAIASVALEGLTVSSEQDVDFSEYIEGKLTLDEVLERAYARYGRTSKA